MFMSVGGLYNDSFVACVRECNPDVDDRDTALFSDLAPAGKHVMKNTSGAPAKSSPWSCSAEVRS